MFETLEDRRLMSGTVLASPTASGYTEQDNLYPTQTAVSDSSAEDPMESLPKIVHAEFKRG